MPRLIPNFENRVGKLPKPANYSQALQPRFEAVRKAFHAIEDRVAAGMTEPGLVRINILHLTDPYKFRDEIADNGIGLDDGRYEAFHTIDTDFKRTRGSKGAGRLFWLDVFECVKVESMLMDGSVVEKRCFTFTAINDEQSIEGSLPHGYVAWQKTGIDTMIALQI